ncbi:Small-conductance mechanosensitive channel [Defluviimonas aquaemixtae]|uniref:Small-conductance mechanosensitive channel n=1 Tax=Albidovulum aquaemixtae TaxID=1542388 RepID=A0A2R8B289_9RHOB|nr:mechanosensitive ion channel family protein [Defluviimonas aquaemixtae]SPH16662.1 Small-conductance mechanosensitive channel [Defluviimonas aquaemixtae]
MDQITADTGNVLEKIDSWVDGFFRLLPNIAVAFVLLLIFWFLAIGASALVRRMASRRGRENLGDVAASLARWMIVILGVMLAVTIIAPSVTPADLFAGLGISSVAIGFAFKDILQNMLAGILILLRQPFEVGDQIVSGGHEGTVERIETRATLIKTYDGRRVVIPNADIYTDAVVVNTAFDQRRSEYDIQIGCNDDWDEACRLMVKATKGCEGVLSEPAPEALPWAIAESGNNVRLRWWTDPDRASVVQAFSRVIEASYKALDAAGIDMPYPTQVMLFHDQTEETDGDRARRRDGWPKRPDGNNPKPHRIADALAELRKAGKSSERASET